LSRPRSSLGLVESTNDDTSLGDVSSSRLLALVDDLLSIGVLGDGSVDLLVELLKRLGLVVGHALVPSLELSVVFLLIFLLELGHVREDVVSEDPLSVLASLKLGVLLLSLSSGLTSLVDNLLNLGLGVTRESLGRVRNVER
jgi:hypothetical protein